MNTKSKVSYAMNSPAPVEAKTNSSHEKQMCETKLVLLKEPKRLKDLM
jgi:hypothetical protein